MMKSDKITIENRLKLFESLFDRHLPVMTYDLAQCVYHLLMDPYILKEVSISDLLKCIEGQY